METHDSFMLQTCISIAVSAHEGQVDKAGVPYILHPMRVMMRGATTEEMAVGILHDVLEDTKVTEAVLRDSGVPEYIIDAVRLLTKRQGEPEDQYLRQIKANKLARTVKINDIDDNMLVWRLRQLDEETRTRLVKKYNRYMDILWG